MSRLEETHVVTCFLRNRGEVLLLRRSEQVGSYQGRWGGVAGHAEGDPEAAARREIEEETGLWKACTLVRHGGAFEVEDEDLGKRWVVHPFLFDCDDRDASIDWESVEADWVPPTAILERATVPELWTSYRHVAPTVASIRDDREHGSAWLSLRALEVLRDAAAELAKDQEIDADAGWARMTSLAHELMDARPAMTALHNRVHRSIYRAMRGPGDRAGDREQDHPGGSAPALAEAAHQVLQEAVDADHAAARAAAELIAGKSVFTLSRSGTVAEALAGTDGLVTVAVSEPLGEGVGLAEHLARAGVSVRLCPDAAIAYALHAYDVDLVLVGADEVRPGGSVVNKVGTHLLALAAAAAGVPVYAVAACDKIAPASTSADASPRSDDTPGHSPGHSPEHPRVDRSAVYAGDLPLEVVDVLFETTPAELFAGMVTEAGTLDRSGIREIAQQHLEQRGWQHS